MKTKPKIEIDIAEVERLASLGLTQEQIADALGVCEKTLRNRRKENPEFSDAIKRGQAKGISSVANVLFEKAMGGDVASLIFYLKARGGWKETQRIESSDTKTDNLKNVYAKMREAVTEKDEEPV